LLLAQEGRFAYEPAVVGSWRRHKAQWTTRAVAGATGAHEESYLRLVVERLADAGKPIHLTSGRMASIIARHSDRALLNSWRMALLSGDRRAVLRTFLSLVLLATYLVALVPASAFRLKRLLFGRKGNLPATCTCTTRSRATGLYSEERAFFAKLKVTQPREVPFDLLVPLMVVAFWLLVLGLNAQWLGDAQPGYSGRDRVMLAFLLLLPLGRLWWLAQLYYLRVHDSDGTKFGREQGKDTPLLARASLICGAGSLVFMPLGFLALVLAVLHWLRNDKVYAKARSGLMYGAIGALTSILYLALR